jgi:hypothetical protein
MMRLEGGGCADTKNTFVGCRPYPNMATDLKTYKFNHSMCGGRLSLLTVVKMLILVIGFG